MKGFSSVPNPQYSPRNFPENKRAQHEVTQKLFPHYLNLFFDEIVSALHTRCACKTQQETTKLGNKFLDGRI